MSDSKDDAFLEECRSVARCFLYFSIEGDPETRSPNGATKKTDGIQVNVPLNEDPQAMETAKKLRELGDQMDDWLKSKMEAEVAQTRSVWDIGRGEFFGVCDRVITSCRDRFKSNWERVCVVFRLMGGFVREVRQQEGTYQSASESSTSSRDVVQTDSDRNQTPSLRERNLQKFACDYLRDSGLQKWIETQGGMVSCGFTCTFK